MGKRTFWAIAVLSALAAFATAVALIDTDRLTVMPPQATPDADLRTSVSTIVIPLSLSLELIEKRLNKDLPESLYSFEKKGVRVKCWDVPDALLEEGDDIPGEWPGKDCVYLDFDVWIMRNGHIGVSVEDEELILKVPARGRTVARGTGPVSRHLKKTAHGEFTVTFRGTLAASPEGAFDLQIATDYQWDVPVLTKVLGREIDLRKPIDRLLRKGLDKVEGKAKKIVSDQTRLEEKALGTYRRILEPVRVARDPDVWMTVMPKALHFTGIEARKDRLLAPVALEADLRTHIGSRPDYAPPQSLPVMDGRQIPGQDFIINLPIILTYGFLQEELEKALEGTAVSLGKAFPDASAVITGTHFFPSGKKLAMGVDFHTRGLPGWLSAEGSAFLVGTPMVNSDEKTLSIEGLEFARRTTNSFLDLGSFVLHRPLLSFLRKALRFSLESAYDEVLGEADEAFNRNYPNGITLRGSMREVAIVEIQTRRRDLVVYAQGRGKLEALWVDD